ncbi:hypothetical protein ABZ807_09545 [Micromonospora sp. NPDC047548]|uniref:hypothetical protein n=1 Tax=Micromonospora sp. NPDC047548 TaxID=3155624 RepID=UPI0033FC200C
MVRLLAHLRRRPAPRIDATGPAIQRAEQEKAKSLLLAQARRRQAQHLHDGPIFGVQS